MTKQIIHTRSVPRPVFIVEVVENNAEGSWDDEPYTVLQNKIEFLMKELGCSEQAANRMVFGLLG